MPAPHPLTGCPPPALDWSRPGTPAARDFGDIYFSTDGGLAESQAVFLEGCGLPERWHHGADTPHVIAELGFGTGLNFLSTWTLWEQTSKSGHLHFISIEKFPLCAAELRKAYAEQVEFQDKLAQLLELWPGRVKGFHRLEITPSLTLTLIHDDVLDGLMALDARVDSWFLDGFSPSKNPAMWSAPVMAHLARLSRPCARLATFSVAGSVRTALTEAGFSVAKHPGFGRKRHRLEAVFDPPRGQAAPYITASHKQAEIKPVIIGGGIAGASVARAFVRTGIRPTLIEKEPDLSRAASGNPVALIRPRFDLQDRAESRFFLSSYMYALAAYTDAHKTVEVIQARGVQHLAKTPAEHQRFNMLADQGALPSAHMQAGKAGLYMGRAAVIKPQAVIQLWTQNVRRIRAKVAHIEKTGALWDVQDAQGQSVASATHVILCAGADIRALTGCEPPALRFSKGQLTWAKTHAEIDAPLTYGGYAIPVADHILVGATHKRLGTAETCNPTVAEDQENLSKLTEATGLTLTQAKKKSRASIRVTTPDTLPVMDQLDTDLWILSGLGSRGFVFAPMLGAALVSQILEHPTSMDRQALARFKRSQRFKGRL